MLNVQKKNVNLAVCQQIRLLTQRFGLLSLPPSGKAFFSPLHHDSYQLSIHPSIRRPHPLPQAPPPPGLHADAAAESLIARQPHLPPPVAAVGFLPPSPGGVCSGTIRRLIETVVYTETLHRSPPHWKNNNNQTKRVAAREKRKMTRDISDCAKQPGTWGPCDVSRGVSHAVAARQRRGSAPRLAWQGPRFRCLSLLWVLPPSLVLRLHRSESPPPQPEPPAAPAPPPPRRRSSRAVSLRV